MAELALEGRGMRAALGGAPRGALVVVAAMLSFAPVAGAQSLSEQVGLLAGHAEQIAGGASTNTTGFVANATNESWQASEFNWTREWSCITVSVANEDAHRAAQDAGVCPALPDAAAGQDDPGDADEAVADAVPLGNDTETAVDDEVAALEALVNDTLADPTNVTGLLERVQDFAGKTVDFVKKIIGGVPDIVAGAFMAVADALVEVGETIGGAVGDAVLAVADAFREAGMAVVGVLGDLVHGLGVGVSAGAGGVASGATGVVDGVGVAVSATGDALADAANAVVDAVREVIGGHGGPFRGSGSRDRGSVSLPDVDDKGLLGIDLPI